jgi:hypothetical protein
MIRVTMGSSAKPDSEATESKVQVKELEDNWHIQQRVNFRGDNSYETDMAQPLGIPHWGGRAQDFDRSVSAR